MDVFINVPARLVEISFKYSELKNIKIFAFGYLIRTVLGYILIIY